mmetsp:Transcript_56944/g.123251  ORF Transcript_56944/g.123251 Transcript_56944/m.123251 type:complete len:600 (-) Transcript_56944:54-1853(-)
MQPSLGAPGSAVLSGTQTWLMPRTAAQTEARKEAATQLRSSAGRASGDAPRCGSACGSAALAAALLAAAPIVRQRASGSRIAQRAPTAVVRAAAAPPELQAGAGLGICGLASDLPKSQALGIELRATAAFAAPIYVTNKSFVEEPYRIRYKLTDDVAKNEEILSSTVKKLVDHFGWKSVAGCSFTKKVSVGLGLDKDDSFLHMESLVGDKVSKWLKGKIPFVHTVIHTDAAGYSELVWGQNSVEERWRGQVVLICTLGQNVGAVLFNDGRRVRNSPLNSLFLSKWNATLSSFPRWSPDGKYTPPAPGSEDYDVWAKTVDGHLSDIVSSISGPVRMVVIPTGRTATGNQHEYLLPRLSRTAAVVKEKKGDVDVIDSDEASVVRGAAICALREFELAQVWPSLQTMLSGANSLQSLSKQQLELIFDKIDHNCSGSLQPRELLSALEVIGIQRNLNELVDELDTSHDGNISLEEFIAWWEKHVMDARIVTLTSALAWKNLLARSPPEGFGDLVLLEVTFTFCRTCRSFEPKFKQLAQKYSNVRFVQLVGNGTIGAMEMVMKEMEVKVSPAFFVFRRGGELLDQWTGANIQRFEEHLDAVTAK